MTTESPIELVATPRVTVGIPAYNCAPFVRAAVVSALAQDFDDFEVLVIDDRSTDETLAELESIDDPRLRMVRNERNLGQAGNHNAVFAEARAPYVKLLHADDVLEPDALAAEYAAFEQHPSVVLVTSRRRIVDEDGKPVFVRGPRWHEGVVPGHEAIARMVHAGANLIGEPSAVMIRRDVALEVGGMSDTEFYAVDVDFWTRVLDRGDLYFVPKALVRYRVRSDNVTAVSGGGRIDEFEAVMRRAAARPNSGLTDADVDKGLRHARREYALREAFVRVFAIPSGHREKVAFLIVGGWNTLFGYATFAVLWAVLGALWPYWLVLALSYTISTVMAFATQKTFVFRSSGSVLAEFPRFAIVYVVMLIANIVVFPALVRLLGINPYLAQALFTAMAVVFSYLANKYFSFRQAPA